MPGLPRGQGQVTSKSRSVTPAGEPAKKKMAKARPRSKSTKGLRSKSRTPNLSPLQAQLEETQMYMKPHMDDISGCKTSTDRLVMVYRLLPDDVTSIDRLWPLELKNKDSRLRIDLSEQGKECFVAGDHSKSLDFYNKALTYSSGKGIAHTLARRAAFFLATKEHQLALRDLTIALEYGVLETEELLDFLLTHHTSEDTGTAYDNGEEMMSRTIENIQNMHNEKHVPDNQKYLWAKKIKDNLNAALLTEKKKYAVTKDDILKNIVESIKTAAKEQNLDVNLESDELAVPKVESRNPIYPAFSEAAAVFKEAGDDRGRHVKARRDILAGEVIAVDEPHCAMLCTQDFDHIKNHCIHCFRYIRAPLPCEICCCVVFCSKECKTLACNSYHKYECQLRLYELLPQEGQDVFGLFMSLRSITQKPLEYFIEHQDELEKYLDRDESKPMIQEGRYLSSDYKTLLNLVTHLSDLSEDIILRNTVLSIVFLRSLQYSGYFSKYIKPRMKGDRFTITPIETLILRLLYHLIAVQSFNAHPIMRLSLESRSFNWEKIGTCINPSMALFNHSCDANTVRCNVNKSSILVAARHIPAGEEITDSYSVHFSNTELDKRQYHTLKNYMFACECPACKGKWKMADKIPDELARVPNFEQEANFKVGFGDKKLIVDDIRDARRLAELCMNKKTFEDALTAYQDLCQLLEEHIRKPHAYFLQARSGIIHCIWNKYCKPPCNADEDDDEEGFLSGKNNPIYMNQLVENITEINIHNNDLSNIGEDENNDSEKADLIKRTKELVKSSMDKAQDAKQTVLQNKQTVMAVAGSEGSKASSMRGNVKSDLEPWVVEQYNAEQNRKKCTREELVMKEMEDMVAKESAKEFILKEQQKSAEAAKMKLQRQEEEEARIEEAQKRKLERQRECEERSKRLIQQDKEKRQRLKEQETRIMAERKSRKDKETERRQEKEREEMRIRRELIRKEEEEELELLLNETNQENNECLENIDEDDMIADLLKDLDNEKFQVENGHNESEIMAMNGETADETLNQLKTSENVKKSLPMENETIEKEEIGCKKLLDETAVTEKKFIETNLKEHENIQKELQNKSNHDESTIMTIKDKIAEKNVNKVKSSENVQKAVPLKNDIQNKVEANDTVEKGKNDNNKMLDNSAIIENKLFRKDFKQEEDIQDHLQNKEKKETSKEVNIEAIDNLDDFISITKVKEAPQKEDDAENVWAILRKLKDTNYVDNQKKEIRKEQQDLEDTIKNFAMLINKKKKSQEECVSHKRKCAKISSDMETIEEDILPQNTTTYDTTELNNGTNSNCENEDTIPKVSVQEEVPSANHSMLSCVEESEAFFKEAEKFDYATWRDKTVIKVTPIEEVSPEKLAADREYLESLKNKIHTNIQKKNELEKKDEKKDKKYTLPKVIKEKNEKKSQTNSESFEALKSKDRERKRKKKDEKTKSAFEGAQDKTRDVNLKSNRIEKSAEEHKKRIEQLKEKSIALRQQSELREMEFNDISFHFDDLSSLEAKLDAKKKKGRKAARQNKENTVSFIGNLHWTEEESNAWPVADPDKVHSMIGAIKAAAAASASKGKTIDGKSFADDLKNKIITCQNEIEVERKQKEEVKKRNAAETIKLDQVKVKKMLEEVKEEKRKIKEEETLEIMVSKDDKKKTADKNRKETETSQREIKENACKKTTPMKGDADADIVTNVSIENVNGTNSTHINNIEEQKKIEIKNQQDISNHEMHSQKLSGIKDGKNIAERKMIKDSETVSKNHIESQSRKKVLSMRWSGSELFQQDSSESSDSLYNRNVCQEIENGSIYHKDNIKATKTEEYQLEQQQKAKEEAKIRKKEIERGKREKETAEIEKREIERKRKQQEQENSTNNKVTEFIKIEKDEVKSKLEKLANEEKKETKKEIVSIKHFNGTNSTHINNSEVQDQKNIPNRKMTKNSETVSRNHLESQSKKKVPSMRWSGSELFLQDSSESSDSLYNLNVHQEIKNGNIGSQDNTKPTKVEESHLQKQKAKEEAEIRKKEIEMERKEKEIAEIEKREIDRKRRQQEKENEIKKKAAEIIKLEEAESKNKLEKIANDKKKEEEKEALERKAAEDAKKKEETENIEKLKLEKEAIIKKNKEKIAEEQIRQDEETRKEHARKKAIEDAETAMKRTREEMEAKKRVAEVEVQKKIEEEAALIKQRKQEADAEREKEIKKMKEQSKALIEQLALKEAAEEESRIKIEESRKRPKEESKVKKSEGERTISKKKEKRKEALQKKVEEDTENKIVEVSAKKKMDNAKKNNVEIVTVKKESEVNVKPNLMIINTNTDLEVSPVSLRKLASEPRKEVLSMRWSGAEMFQDLNQESKSSFKMEVKAPKVCEDIVEVKAQHPEAKPEKKMSFNSTSSKMVEEAFEESILDNIKQRIPSPMQIEEYTENVKRYSENIIKQNIHPEPSTTRQSKKEMFQSQNEGSLSQQDKMRSQSLCGAPSQERQRSQSMSRPPPPRCKPPPPPPL